MYAIAAAFAFKVFKGARLWERNTLNGDKITTGILPNLLVLDVFTFLPEPGARYTDIFHVRQIKTSNIFPPKHRYIRWSVLYDANFTTADSVYHYDELAVLVWVL